MRSSLLARIAAAAAAATVGLAALAFLPATAGAAQAGAAQSGAAQARVAGPTYRTAGALSGVAAASGGNAWAVGYAGSSSSHKVLMLHWNGRSWTRLTSPKVLDGAGALSAVTVVSANNAWAVGTVGGGLGHALVLHWNGKSWSQVTGVAKFGGQLYGVTAAAGSVWAVGVNLGQTVVAPLLLHWNGKAWSRATIKLNPASQSESILTGVAVTGAKTAWSVGYTSQGIPNSMLVRWNGKAWSTTASFPLTGIQRSLEGVAAGPHGTAFAVGNGETGPIGGPGVSVPLGMRWTGKIWQKTTVSAPRNSGLNSVTVAPGGAAWATGYHWTSASATSAIIVHWNGRTWTTVKIPSGTSALAGLGFAAAGNGWAVGARGADTVILHWNGHTWS
ncbi:MAG TPA: hypothetical protein VHZ33_13545 [Trebonia sp.]|nr:hypothetical protein [Trebonia sp.]